MHAHLIYTANAKYDKARLNVHKVSLQKEKEKEENNINFYKNI